MELPRELTSLPEARRYSRNFEVPRSKTYGERDTFIINIPPIDRTYMTKNTKLHFDFDFTYTEASSDKWKYIYGDIMTGNGAISPTNTVPVANVTALTGHADSYFGTGTTSPSQSPFYAFTKPIPSFDINGPYGLIKNIRVYDFLGTTLLEDVPRHDILTATLTDFDMKDENFQLHRPEVLEHKLRKSPCSLIDPENDVGYEKPSIKGFQLVPDGSGNLIGVNMTSVPIKISAHFAIDLYSFLGKLSDKFVPLHNGFRIEFVLNDMYTPLSLCTAWGGLNVFYNVYSRTTAVLQNDPNAVTLDPSIQEFKIKNIYIKSELLELNSEMDKGIDKVVHFQGFKYQDDYFNYQWDKTSLDKNDSNKRVNTVKAIMPSFRSVNKIIIGQRPMYNTTVDLISRQNIGFRIKNYLSGVELLFNDAVVGSLDNTQETIQAAVSALGPMDYYLGLDDFSLQDGSSKTSSTQGYQFPSPNYIYLGLSGGANFGWWPGSDIDTAYLNGEFYTPLYDIHTVNSLYQGKFLAVFDTRLPGTVSESIGGIDTTKNVLKYNIKSDSIQCRQVTIDVMCQHDSLLRIEPGKSTTVSF